jgi:hypothetical protein
MKRLFIVLEHFLRQIFSMFIPNKRILPKHILPFRSKSHVAGVTTIILLLDWFMRKSQTLLHLKIIIDT